MARVRNRPVPDPATHHSGIDLDSTISETYGLAKEGARHHGYTGCAMELSPAADRRIRHRQTC